MVTYLARRWFAGLGLAGTILAVSVAPAFAAPVEDLDIYANDAVVAPGGPKKWINLYALTAERGGDYTVTVDRSGVADFATVSNSGTTDACTESGAVLTCTVSDEDDDGSYLSMVSLTVQAEDGAGPGREGEVAFTVRDADSSSASFRSTVSIGEGVDLAAQEELDLTAAPGATVSTPLRVENRGGRATHGAVLFVTASYGLSPSKRYRNCEYTTERFSDLGFACHFDTTIEPGAAARLDSTFGFTVPADTLAPSSQIAGARWFTPADWTEFTSNVSLRDTPWQRGTEGDLTLEPLALRRAVQTDVNTRNTESLVRLTVTGDQGVDVAAVGATVSGEVGATVPVTVGWVNNGPAAIGYGVGFWVEPRITLPAGVTAVRAPDSCSSGGEPGRPGGAVYTCFWPHRVGKGERAEFEFDLRIDKAGDRPGQVTVRIEDGTRDLDPANDTAEIVVDATDDGGSGDPGENPGENPDGESPDGDDGGGGGGSLPITGARAGLIAGIGGVLLAAGAVGFVAARRRRTRFVA